MHVLFGGTFDPIHQGHITVALAVAKQLACSVTLLPNGQPPHKTSTTVSAQHRLAMLNIAISSHPELRVSDWELQQDTPSWTVNTAKHWRTQFPNSPLVWVIGEDSLGELHHWHHWHQLAELCHLAVLPRQGAKAPTPEVDKRFPLAALSQLHQSAHGLRAHLAMDLQPISSTLIRQQLAEQHHSAAVPTKVMAYIQEHGLYGVPTA